MKNEGMIFSVTIVRVFLPIYSTVLLKFFVIIYSSLHRVKIDDSQHLISK